MTSSVSGATAERRTAARSLFAGKQLFWLPILPLLILDLWSKRAVFEHIASLDLARWEQQRGDPVFELGWLDFSLVAWSNTGTVWGLFQNFQHVLMVARCLAVVLILYFVWRCPARARLQQLVLGLIMAGAVGNLYDNFTQPEGGVRDFLHFQGSWFGWRWDFPAFNVADACICVGAITLAFLLWRTDSQGAASGASGGGERGA